MPHRSGPAILHAMGSGDLQRARAWIERATGVRVERLEALAGGAGARRYWRVHLADASTLVWMHAIPEDARILPPALRAETAGIPFVEMTRLLTERGVPVPALVAVDAESRWVLLEDLGDRHLCDLGPHDLEKRLAEAIDLLVHVHATPESDSLPFRRAFDAEWVRFELATFEAHGLPADLRGPELAEELDRLAEAIAALPRVLCLRDVQSQNLMLDPAGRLRVIDYQDALAAPRELDLAALLFDSYIELSDATRAALLERYARAAGPVDPGPFALLAVQRKCKDYGRYCFVVEVRGDARYAPFQARARASVLSQLGALPDAHAPLAARLRAAFGERP